MRRHTFAYTYTHTQARNADGSERSHGVTVEKSRNMEGLEACGERRDAQEMALYVCTLVCARVIICIMITIYVFSSFFVC